MVIDCRNQKATLISRFKKKKVKEMRTVEKMMASRMLCKNWMKLRYYVALGAACLGRSHRLLMFYALNERKFHLSHLISSTDQKW